MLKIKLFLGITVIYSLFFFNSCALEEIQPPTKTLMQGTWELIAATNDTGLDILNKVAFPVTALQLTDDNGMVGTQGPMFTYSVYGGSKWVSASAKIKQAFDYANFRFNTGEFFVEPGNPTRFAVEAKLQATAIAGGLTDVLSILGVGNGFLQQTIYHKFINVKVTLPKMDNSTEYNTMIWEFDEETTAVYNYKDGQGNILVWGGWPVNNFSKGKYTFMKKGTGLNEIVKAHL